MKFTLLILAILALFACHKSDSNCQRWYCYETCESKQPGVICSPASTDTFQVSVCNGDLTQVAPGATVQIFEDASFIKYRHYLRQGGR